MTEDNPRYQMIRPSTSIDISYRKPQGIPSPPKALRKGSHISPPKGVYAKRSSRAISQLEGTNVVIDEIDCILESGTTDKIIVAHEKCRKYVMKPYLILTSVLGWRPLMMANNLKEASLHVIMFNHFYTFMVIVIILAGYALKYASCFRQDGYQPYIAVCSDKNQVFTQNLSSINETRQLIANDSCISKTCSGNFVSLYLIPDMLHFFAYIFMIFFTRITIEEERKDTEYLLERIYFETTEQIGRKRAHSRLVCTLLWFLGLCGAWVVLSFICHCLHILSSSELCFTWMQPESIIWHYLLTSFTIITLTWNDIITATIVANYLLQCHLIRAYINRIIVNIRENNYKKDFIFVARKYEVLRLFVDLLNRNHSVGVALLAANFACRSVVTLYGLLSEQTTAEFEATVITSYASILWLSLVSFPIFYAARLTYSCHQLRDMGHKVRCRTYGYIDVTQEDLDSFLLYTSNMRIDARMLCIPIRSANVMPVVLSIACVLVILGQINVLKF